MWCACSHHLVKICWVPRNSSRSLLNPHIFEYIYIFGWLTDGLFHFFSGDKMFVCLYVSMCESECLFSYISMNVWLYNLFCQRWRCCQCTNKLFYIYFHIFDVNVDFQRITKMTRDKKSKFRETDRDPHLDRKENYLWKPFNVSTQTHAHHVVRFGFKIFSKWFPQYRWHQIKHEEKEEYFSV